MRTYTLFFSIVGHAVVACALLFTTVLATDELPVPREASTFVEVVASLPPTVPPAAKPRVAPTVPSNAAPMSAPDGVARETEIVAPDDFDAAPTTVVGGIGNDPGALRPELPPPPPPAPAPKAPLHVGGVISAPTKIVHVPPAYPAIARSARVSGVVILEATIGEDGTVRNVRVLRSIPLLDQAAIDAVRQWRFTPTLLNGQPVAVLMTVTVAFNLE